MKIVLGRGKTRRVYQGVHGSVVTRSSDAEQKAYINNVCELLGVQ